ncbi:MAG: response regulator [Pseudonocardiaceae bacterium]
MITVLVAEDHPLVRRGIVGFLNTQPDLSVVAEAGDGAEAVRLAIEHRPDVAVIDLQLPRIDGIETIRRLTHDCPGTRVVVLTSHSTDADIFPAVHAGALSYLLKEATPEELAEAVRAASAGKTVKTHVSAILMKLQLADRTQAVVHAWRHGLLRRQTER